jgi:transcriptional regulator with PAS, ATPase and Fis domain
MPNITCSPTAIPIIVDNMAQGADHHAAGRPQKSENSNTNYRKYQARGLTTRFHFMDNLVRESAALRETIEKGEGFRRVDSVILIEGRTGPEKRCLPEHPQRKRLRQRAVRRGQLRRACPRAS